MMLALLIVLDHVSFVRMPLHILMLLLIIIKEIVRRIKVKNSSRMPNFERRFLRFALFLDSRHLSP
ncbi:MAG: hypothetical protein MZU97_06130 [Bacillus subtilis]|nr:hypothetical protein [Bacillus subtilis]